MAFVWLGCGCVRLKCVSLDARCLGALRCSQLPNRIQIPQSSSCCSRGSSAEAHSSSKYLCNSMALPRLWMRCPVVQCVRRGAMVRAHSTPWRSVPLSHGAGAARRGVQALAASAQRCAASVFVGAFRGFTAISPSTCRSSAAALHMRSMPNSLFERLCWLTA